MKIEQVLQTYDESYATEYDQTFLQDVWTRESVAFQLQLLGEQLRGARNWLDVACGTGYVLSRFPEVERTGLDLSSAMLAIARRKNPGVALVQRNFREPYPEWDGRWDVISCMWWAYCLGESMTEVQQVVANLASWTSERGKCFVPLCNPQKFDRDNIKIPYIDPKVPGRCMITGITWTWIQPNGKRHDEVVSPQVEHVAAMFRQYFDVVRIVEGPLDRIGEGWRVQDILLAEKKKQQPTPGELFPAEDGECPGRHEWLLSTAGGNVATAVYPTGKTRHVRVLFEKLKPGATPSDIQISKAEYPIETGKRYRLAFRVRADGPRPFAFGAGRIGDPCDNLGLYCQDILGPVWKMMTTEFCATASAPNARIFFELGQSTIPVELSDLTFISPD